MCRTADFFGEQFPAKRVLCPCCEGDRTSSAHLGSFSAEDMACDPEFTESYFRGDYDRQCDTCEGLGYIHNPDFNAMSQEQRDYFNELEDEDSANWMEAQAERRMCA